MVVSNALWPTELDKCKGRDDLSQSGVYFLFCTSDQTGENVVYIGQAGTRKNGEGILYRLQEHKHSPDKGYCVRQTGTFLFCQLLQLG